VLPSGGLGTPHTGQKLVFEGDGWVGYTGPNQHFATRIHLSYKPTPARWVVDEVRFADFRVTARMLRDLPLGMIESWVNQLAQQGLADVISAKLSDAVQFGVEGRAVWVDKLPPAPASGAKPDEFYRRVGEIYAKAALVSPRPAAELAEAWDVPLSSVHRWVRVARRRGHLPPTEKGRKA
jgi:hypothetical protein